MSASDIDALKADIVKHGMALQKIFLKIDGLHQLSVGVFEGDLMIWGIYPDQHHPDDWFMDEYFRKDDIDA